MDKLVGMDKPVSMDTDTDKHSSMQQPSYPTT